jgi:acetylornithine deacetylase
MYIAANEHFTTAVLARLVRTDSVNPSLVAGARGEAEIADVTARILEDLDVEVFRHEPEPGRVSIVGRLRGETGGPALMLNAHYDTVGVDGMADPFGASIREGRLYGRGAYDMKGALAACIGAVRALREADVRLKGDLLVAAVADEEHASMGTQDLIGRYHVDGAIVTEPTSLRLCVAHKGFTWAEVRTRGRAAHGSRPDLGIDANLHMGRVLHALESLERELRERPGHPLLGPGSLHAALLRGGSGLSTYAAECTLAIERRTIPGETGEGALAEIEALLAALRRQDPTFDVSLSHILTRSPFEARADSPIADALAAAASASGGVPPVVIGETPWMDAALLADAGVDTVVFGPHGHGAHADEEWVDLASVHRLATVLADTAMRYCGTAQTGSPR